MPKKNLPTSLPHNLEAEKTVLGAMLCDPNVILNVLPVVSEVDFFDPVYRTVYKACCQLHEQRRPLDFITVADALAADKEIQAIGGSAFLADLAASVPTSSHSSTGLTRVWQMPGTGIVGRLRSVENACFDSMSV